VPPSTASRLALSPGFEARQREVRKVVTILFCDLARRRSVTARRRPSGAAGTGASRGGPWRSSSVTPSWERSATSPVRSASSRASSSARRPRAPTRRRSLPPRPRRDRL